MVCSDTALVAAGTYFFKFPNHFSTGGVTGLAVLINAALPALPASNVAAVLNLLSLVLGFAVLGRGFGVRTIFCTVLFSDFLTANTLHSHIFFMFRTILLWAAPGYWTFCFHNVDLLLSFTKD